MFVMADCLAQLVDLALHGPVFYSIIGHPILGGSSHGLIIFRRAVLDYFGRWLKQRRHRRCPSLLKFAELSATFSQRALLVSALPQAGQAH